MRTDQRQEKHDSGGRIYAVKEGKQTLKTKAMTKKTKKQPEQNKKKNSGFMEKCVELIIFFQA